MHIRKGFDAWCNKAILRSNGVYGRFIELISAEMIRHVRRSTPWQ